MDALGRFRSEWFLWFAKAITKNRKMWTGVRNLTPVFLEVLTYLGVNGFISTPTLWATTRLWNLVLSLVDETWGIKLVNFFMLPSFIEEWNWLSSMATKLRKLQMDMWYSALVYSAKKTECIITWTMLYCAWLLSHVRLFCYLIDCSPPGSSLHGIL